MTFEAFARIVDGHLRLLGVDATVELDARQARWTLEPFVAELQPMGDRARVLISSHGELHHASEPGPQTERGARMLGEAIAVLFVGLRPE